MTISAKEKQWQDDHTTVRLSNPVMEDLRQLKRQLSVSKKRDVSLDETVSYLIKSLEEWEREQ